jgi:hypothetical protein
MQLNTLGLVTESWRVDLYRAGDNAASSCSIATRVPELDRISPKPVQRCAMSVANRQ